MDDYLAQTQSLHSRVRDLAWGDPDLKISDKLLAVVLVNSLPRAKFGTVVQQLLENIKTLTTSQVTARLRLEALSMASNEERFEEVYAATTSKINSQKVGHRPNDLCKVHQNPKHTHAQCFPQKDKTKDKQNESVSNDEIVKQYQAMMLKKEEKKSNIKTAANTQIDMPSDDSR